MPAQLPTLPSQRSSSPACAPNAPPPDKGGPAVYLPEKIQNPRIQASSQLRCFLRDCVRCREDITFDAGITHIIVITKVTNSSYNIKNGGYQGPMCSVGSEEPVLCLVDCSQQPRADSSDVIPNVQMRKLSTEHGAACLEPHTRSCRSQEGSQALPRSHPGP